MERPADAGLIARVAWAILGVVIALVTVVVGGWKTGSCASEAGGSVEECGSSSPLGVYVYVVVALGGASAIYCLYRALRR
ncbi:hypothetical protein [Luteimicrobium sp. DT211]|uniref:hypothetical protein n=1 Tax=Luteimicrobium sp. DT211 TaxID=3393412 RepID=UPI003CE94E25